MSEYMRRSRRVSDPAGARRSEQPGGESHREWQPRGRDFDARQHQETLLALFEAVRSADHWDADSLPRILAQHPRGDKASRSTAEDAAGGYFSKIELVRGYQQLTAAGVLPFERQVLRRLQMKPVRTSSGVAPVTVLTEPASCPGRCIFCPDAEGMPKSYLPDEPAARRAAECEFDPYIQVRTRLETFEALGHTADKVELLILGGTWSAYSRQYREWFVKRCLDALNDDENGTRIARPAKCEASPVSSTSADERGQITVSPCHRVTLVEAQARNETASHRNVGLVIETRPDWITPAEIRHLRHLGVTKVQLGVQSLDDRILVLNRRGHDVATVRRAVTLLRAAGFKLLLHWMPNLHGATPESDREDFARLWSDPALRPDELKIYPCSIIAGTELYRLWQEGQYRPYTDDELIELVADCKAIIPPYCRVNRVFRDIPADDIVAGVKSSNLRQLVHERMSVRGQACRCIRCREVRQAAVSDAELRLVVHEYETSVGREQFLGYETAEGRLAGFLRLSLPATSRHLANSRVSGGSNDHLPEETSSQSDGTSEVWDALPEICGAAMIREVHIYGPALGIGAESAGEAQHLGLGRRLIEEAKRRARETGFERLAVISAIGTRPYYERLGFERGELYMTTGV